MKKFILLAILAIASLSAAAGTGDAVFNKAIAAYKAAKGIAVKYSMTGAVGNSSGEIIMQGNKFCITASNMICWYNGKTQWSYSTMSNEVSIMEPTASELQVVNPFSVISNFQTAYTATLMKGNASSNIVQLRPKNARTSQFSQVVVTISKKNNLPSKIVATMRDKSKISITLSGYRTGGNFPASTFVYNKNMSRQAPMWSTSDNLKHHNNGKYIDKMPDNRLRTRWIHRSNLRLARKPIPYPLRRHAAWRTVDHDQRD